MTEHEKRTILSKLEHDDELVLLVKNLKSQVYQVHSHSVEGFVENNKKLDPLPFMYEENEMLTVDLARVFYKIEEIMKSDYFRKIERKPKVKKV